MSDLHRDTPDWLTQIRIRHNDERFHQLNGLLNSQSASVWTYLMTVNGGSAAGVLAFIGTDSTLAKLRWPYLVLLIFLVGLILVGCAHAVMVHKLQALERNWTSNVAKYWKSEISWSHVEIEDQCLVDKWRIVPWILGWASLISFLVGVTWAAYGFHRLAFHG